MRDDLEIGPDAEVLVEQPRQLADRHAVARRNGELADEGLAARLERDALDVDAADRIGPIADDDLDAVPLAARMQLAIVYT